MDLAWPIRVDVQSLYNPTYNYRDYLVPALLPMLLQIIIMLGAVLVINAEHTEGTFANLVETAQGRPGAVLLGKALPYLALHGLTAFAMIGLLFPLFGISMRGPALLAVAFTLYFVAACFFPAMALSALIRDSLMATEVAVFVNTPAFIFSGYTFPLWAMPSLHAWFAQALPFTHFMSGFVKIYQMGAPARMLMPELLRLSLFLWPSLALLGWLLYRDVRRITPAPEVAAV